MGTRAASRCLRGVATAMALGAILATAGAPGAEPALAAASVTPPTLTTTQFVNRFDTEPYVGNGYFSQRIPAAGMGLLTGLGTIGWPLGTPRFTEALAAGLYAKTNASVAFYPDEVKQVIALIPTWSTLTFSAPGHDTYSPQTVTASQISGYRQSEDAGTGTVTTSGIWTSAHRRKAAFTYQVFTDRGREHVGVVRLTLTPQWNGRTTAQPQLQRGAPPPSRHRALAVAVLRGHRRYHLAAHPRLAGPAGARPVLGQ